MWDDDSKRYYKYENDENRDKKIGQRFWLGEMILFSFCAIILLLMDDELTNIFFKVKKKKILIKIIIWLFNKL